LKSLPGIGPVLTRGLVAGRPYSSVEDLRRVEGIGKKRLAKIRPLVPVRSATAKRTISVTAIVQHRGEGLMIGEAAERTRAPRRVVPGRILSALGGPVR
jgi:hypothetical protein